MNGVKTTYYFRPNRVEVEVLVEMRSDGTHRCATAPIHLLKDSEDWEICWQIVKGEGVKTAIFDETHGVNIDGLPPKLHVRSSKRSHDDPEKWITICNNQVIDANMASYEVKPIVNGIAMSHDPSIAVTADPIPPASISWSKCKGLKIRILPQRVKKGQGKPVGVQAAV